MTPFEPRRVLDERSESGSVPEGRTGEPVVRYVGKVGTGYVHIKTRDRGFHSFGEVKVQGFQWTDPVIGTSSLKYEGTKREELPRITGWYPVLRDENDLVHKS